MSELGDIAKLCARIDERTEAHTDRFDAIDKRIDQEREDRTQALALERRERERGIDSVRASLKRIPAVISAVMASAIAGAAKLFGGSS